jgi:hypothetical protein
MANRSSVPTPAHAIEPPTSRAEAYAPLIAILVLIIVVAAIILLPFDYRVAMTLGLLQGLSEFLPISSSAHLILAPWFFGWPDPGLTYDVALHVGTLVAVAAYFWRDWIALLSAAPRPRSPNGRLFWLLIVGAIPGGIAGVLLDRLAERGYAHREPGCSIARIKIEVVTAIEQVASHNCVAAHLPVHARDPVKVVRMCGQGTFHSAKLYSQARWITIVHERAEWRGIAGRNRVWTKRFQRRQTLASRKASRKRGYAVGRGHIAGAGIETILRDELLIESAEEEHLVLDNWPADGEPAKLIIGAGN